MLVTYYVCNVQSIYVIYNYVNVRCMYVGHKIYTLYKVCKCYLAIETYCMYLIYAISD